MNFRSECESQVKGFSGAAYKKFKSLNEAQAYVDGQPASKRFKTDKTLSLDELKALNDLNKKRRKINFANRLKNLNKKDSSGSDLDEEFLKIPEYNDEPSSSKQDKSPKNVLDIKFECPPPTTEMKIGSMTFNVDSQGFVHVYTDGSCENNGKFTAAAGLGVYFGINHILNTSNPVTGRPTNNSGEIQAAIQAIELAEMYQIKKLKIFTDSQFLIKASCIWMENWKKKDWKLSSGKSVVNVKDFKRLDELLNKDIVVKWCYIPGHKGFHGNEEADKLARIGASRYRTAKERKEDEEFEDYDS